MRKTEMMRRVLAVVLSSGSGDEFAVASLVAWFVPEGSSVRVEGVDFSGSGLVPVG